MEKNEQIWRKDIWILSIFVLSPVTVSMVKFFVNSKQPKKYYQGKKEILK